MSLNVTYQSRDHSLRQADSVVLLLVGGHLGLCLNGRLAVAGRIGRRAPEGGEEAHVL